MRTLLIGILMYMTASAMAQKNMVYFELAGNGGLASLNYERQLTKELGLSLRIGVGVTAFDFEKEEPFESVPDCALCGIDLSFPEFYLSIPVSSQYLFDLNHNNYLEIGLGYTWQGMGNSDEKPIHVFHGAVGFRRYFGKNQKWMWKINLTPIIGVVGDNVYRSDGPDIWGGFSIGRRF